MPKVYLTGVFYFMLMYTGSNILPIARFLKITHMRQAFRSEEVQMNYTTCCQVNLIKYYF